MTLPLFFSLISDISLTPITLHGPELSTLQSNHGLNTLSLLPLLLLRCCFPFPLLSQRLAGQDPTQVLHAAEVAAADPLIDNLPHVRRGSGSDISYVTDSLNDQRDPTHLLLLEVSQHVVHEVLT